METTELTIGNIIYDDAGIPVEVFSLTRDEINNDSYFYEYHPVPLTDEILRDWCGFKSDHPAYYYIFIEDDKFHVYYNNSGLHIYSVKYRYAYLTEIKYLHQLQNLYFALTGEELTINIQKQ
jgi:hypothetical protein